MKYAFYDWGPIDYEEGFGRQKEYQRLVVEGSAAPALILCQHPPVLTLGASFHEENLLLSPDEYRSRGIQIVKTDRGGDVTFHGPGQLVAYPIFELGVVGKDLHRWLRELEEIFIQTVGVFGLAGRRVSPHTGVWIGNRKIAAIGVKVSRWVSVHGVALNCNNDLEPFENIVPCGIDGYGVTSITEATGSEISVEDVKPHVAEAFQSVLSIELEHKAWEPS